MSLFAEASAYELHKIETLQCKQRHRASSAFLNMTSTFQAEEEIALKIKFIYRMCPNDKVDYKKNAVNCIFL